MERWVSHSKQKTLKNKKCIYTTNTIFFILFSFLLLYSLYSETKPSPIKGYYTSWLRPNIRQEETSNTTSNTTSTTKQTATPDLVIIGMQECSKKYKANWQKTILTHLNDSLTTSSNSLSSKNPFHFNEYLLISTVSMVQLNVYMYALASIASEISEVKTETVPTGLGGVYGNKGKESGDRSTM